MMQSMDVNCVCVCVREGGGRSTFVRAVMHHILRLCYLDPACPLCMQHGGGDARESQ